MLIQCFKEFRSFWKKYLFINISYVIILCSLLLISNSITNIFLEPKLKTYMVKVNLYLPLWKVILIENVVVVTVISFFTMAITKYLINLRAKEYSLYLVAIGVSKNYLIRKGFIENLMQSFFNMLLSIVLFSILVIPFNHYFNTMFFNFGFKLVLSNNYIHVETFKSFFMVNLIIFIINYFIFIYKIKRLKIIDLMNYQRVSENIQKFNNSKKKLIISVIALIAMIATTFISHNIFINNKIDPIMDFNTILIVGLLFIVSNFMLMKYLIPIIISTLVKVQSLYYQKLNIIILSNISSKIRSFSTMIANVTTVIVIFMTLTGFINIFDKFILKETVFEFKVFKNQSDIVQLFKEILPYKLVVIFLLSICILTISVFMLAMFFKYVTTAWTEVNRFELLKKLGYSKNDLRIIILKENFTMFIIPWIFAAFESYVGIVYIVNPFLTRWFHEVFFTFKDYISIFTIFTILYIAMIFIISIIYIKITTLDISK